jgi:hypothetical protein
MSSNGAALKIDWNSSNSSNSSGTPKSRGYVQLAPIPGDSILRHYLEFAQQENEAADCFIIGAILPVIGAMLGRRIWFRWGAGKKYPLVFTILTGKAGDRKSTAIRLASYIATQLLPPSAFLPLNFSPESLFDEYDEKKEGQPDKLWMVSEGNLVFSDWTKSSNGERNAARFLDLYDCPPLTESFRRNRTKDEPYTKRFIPETSTNIVIGATFNSAAFQGQAVRAGLARRFLYFVSEAIGRTIVRPQVNDLGPIVEPFRPLLKYTGEIDFDAEATRIWKDFQYDNRERRDELDATQESQASRLSSSPMQTLSVAMIFAACVAAYEQRVPRLITGQILLKAIELVEHSLKGAELLESISERATIHQNAEVLLARIKVDFLQVVYDASGVKIIKLSRSQITGKYAHNSGRAGAWTPQDIFLKFIPALIDQNLARLVEKDGKKETYAFRIEDGHTTINARVPEENEEFEEETPHYARN